MVLSERKPKRQTSEREKEGKRVRRRLEGQSEEERDGKRGRVRERERGKR